MNKNIAKLVVFQRTNLLRQSAPSVAWLLLFVFRPLFMPYGRLGFLAAATLAVLAGCKNPVDSTAKQPGSPPNVKIAQPLNQEVTEWDEFTGHIEAVESVDVRARVGG